MFAWGIKGVVYVQTHAHMEHLPLELFPKCVGLGLNLHLEEGVSLDVPCNEIIGFKQRVISFEAMEAGRETLRCLNMVSRVCRTMTVRSKKWACDNVVQMNEKFIVMRLAGEQGVAMFDASDFQLMYISPWFKNDFPISVYEDFVDAAALYEDIVDVIHEERFIQHVVHTFKRDFCESKRCRCKLRQVVKSALGADWVLLEEDFYFVRQTLAQKLGITGDFVQLRETQLDRIEAVYRTAITSPEE